MTKPTPKLLSIPLSQLRESPTNPRKTFVDVDLGELAASIRENGVEIPILARPLPLGEAYGYEIVAGARRFRASNLVGLTEIPAIVSEMTDREALELQVTENLQRKDLHPLEESDAYKSLQAVGYESTDAIAKKVGKEVGYIAKRLQLEKLTDAAARKAFAANEISFSHALVLARIPHPAMQTQAFVETAGMTAAQAAAHVQATYMRNLKDAPFDKSSKAICEAAGAPTCAACPNRTGNQALLFDEVTGKEICLDPSCWKRKVNADALIKIQTAKDSGVQVIEGPAAKKAMPDKYSGSLVGYVALDGPAGGIATGRTVRQVLGKAAPDPILLKSPFDGSVREVIHEAEFVEAAKAVGLTPVAPKGDDEAKAREKAKERAKRTKAVVAGFVASMRKLLLNGDPSAAVRALVAAHPKSREVLIGAGVLPDIKKDDYSPFDGVVAKALEKVGLGTLVSILLECEIAPTPTGEYPRIMLALARSYDVDVKALEKDYTNGIIRAGAMKEAGKAVDAAIALSSPKGETAMAAAMRKATTIRKEEVCDLHGGGCALPASAHPKRPKPGKVKVPTPTRPGPRSGKVGKAPKAKAAKKAKK